VKPAAALAVGFAFFWEFIHRHRHRIRQTHVVDTASSRNVARVLARSIDAIDPASQD